MAVFTNVSPALINMHDGATPLIPGLPTDLNDEFSANPRFQELMAEGKIVAGTPPPSKEVDPNASVTFFSANSEPNKPTSGGTSTVSGGTSTVSGGTKAS